MTKVNIPAENVFINNDGIISVHGVDDDDSHITAEQDDPDETDDTISDKLIELHGEIMDLQSQIEDIDHENEINEYNEYDEDAIDEENEYDEGNEDTMMKYKYEAMEDLNKLTDKFMLLKDKLTGADPDLSDMVSDVVGVIAGIASKR